MILMNLTGLNAENDPYVLMQVEVKVFGAGKICLKQVPFDDCT